MFIHVESPRSPPWQGSSTAQNERNEPCANRGNDSRLKGSESRILGVSKGLGTLEEQKGRWGCRVGTAGMMTGESSGEKDCIMQSAEAANGVRTFTAKGRIVNRRTTSLDFCICHVAGARMQISHKERVVRDQEWSTARLSDQATHLVRAGGD